MSKHISLDAIKWALGQLKDSCDQLFADFLILKRDGLKVGNSVTITTKSTEESAQALMGITRADGSPVDGKHVFFNPFVLQWRHAGYPRSGTYSTLDRSKTFSRVVRVQKKLGMNLSLTQDYLQRAQEDLRRSKNRPLKVPLQALALWTARYSELPDGAVLADLIAGLKTEYNLSKDEVDAFFTDVSPPNDVFSSAVLDRNGLIDHLFALAPSTGKLEASDEPESVLEDLPESLIEYLRSDLLLPESLLRQLVTLLRAGKHLILTGPPGTGKSTLAARLAEVSEHYAKEFAFPASSGHVFTTATADWTTFDTLGGYMPSDGGALAFQEGLFLKAMRDNNWLVIDELNRSDVDKAFGQLFTVLSGHGVALPFRNAAKKNISIAFDRNEATSSFSEADARYSVGQDWRIIATMNTFDRNLLFQLSTAFVRRFAVVHVGIPDRAELLEWIEGRGLSKREMELITELVGLLYDVRPLGPAIWDDMVQYMAMRTRHSFEGTPVEEPIEAAFVDAVTAYVLPQLDGLNQEDLGKVEGVLAELLKSEPEQLRLRRSFKEVF